MIPILKLKIDKEPYKQRTIKWAPEKLKRGVPVSELSDGQLFNQYNVHRREQIYLDPKIPESVHFQINRSQIPSLPEEIEAQINRNMKKLVVCDMNNGLGAGVFTDAVIERNEYVCVYAGIIQSLDESMGSDNYNMGCALISGDTPREYCINPTHFGNIARFIQDLPIEPGFGRNLSYTPRLPSDITFDVLPYETPFYLDSYLREKIAYANLKPECFNLKSDSLPTITINITLLKTINRINPFEMLGYPYGFEGYWKHRHFKRRFFYKNSYELAPSSLYQCRHVLLTLLEHGSNETTIATVSISAIKDNLRRIFNDNQTEAETAKILKQKNLKTLNLFSAYIMNRFQNRADDTSYIYYPHLNSLITNLPESDEENILKLLYGLIKHHIDEVMNIDPKVFSLIFLAACIQLAKFSSDKEKVILYLFEAKKYCEMLNMTEKHKKYSDYLKKPELFNVIREDKLKDVVDLLPGYKKQSQCVIS